jgi:SAM-dependent methyltransferase
VIPPLSTNAWLRYDTVERLLPPGGGKLLEIGAGLGSAGTLLARRYDYVGLEPDTESYAVATRRIGSAGTVLNMSAEGYAASGAFDVVCAFEVLEHIQDDEAALGHWLRHLSPGGWLLVSVPAGTARFGTTDVTVGHFRRYDRQDLVDVLANAGLGEICVLMYGFPLGYALEAGRYVLARRAVNDQSLEERTAHSGRWLQPPESLAQLTRFGSLPFRYLQRPFSNTAWGTGLVARARKPA